MFGRLRPVVHLYAVCWNEARILPYFFRNYEPWVQRFVFFDNGSTDGTQALLSAKPNVELRQFPWTDPHSFVQSHRTLHNRCWRESIGKADWVVVTATDEHLHHPDIHRLLRRYDRRGVTCVPALGYHMLTREFPAPDATLARVHTIGTPSPGMNKLRLFKPDFVQPNIAIGGHGAEPAGHVVYPSRDELLLLHYKWLGIEYLAQRHKLLDTGLRSGDRVNSWGVHYKLDRTQLEEHFDHMWRHAVDICAPDYQPWRDHPHVRFWRLDTQPPNVARRKPRRYPRLHRSWRRLKRWLASRRLAGNAKFHQTKV
jgi:hypothetical protein